MVNILLQIFAFLFAIFLLVTIHEFGHFWVAKRAGIKVLRFSIGFGKTLWKRQGKDGTEYVIALLPLGGYVRLLDEREGPVSEAEKHLAFNRKPLLSRFLVLLAGPLTNLILGVIIFWIVFVIGIEQVKPVIGKIAPNSIAAQGGLQPGDELLGIDGHKISTWQQALIAVVYRMGEKGKMEVTVSPKNLNQPKTHILDLTNWKVSGLAPQPLESLGITPYQPAIPPVVSKVVKGQPGDLAGLQQGDRILKINEEPVSDWMDVMDYVQKHPAESTTLLIQRGNTQKNLNISIGEKTVSNFKKIGFIGVAVQAPEWPPGMKYQTHYSLLTAWKPAAQQTALFSVFNFIVFGKMVVGHISLQGLGGPITIFTSAKAAFKEGVIVYLSFLGVLSIMLACLNILPIPGLDGGHLLFLIIEAIRGKPLSLTTQLFAWRLGLLLLIAVMLQATINDLMRLL
jgi:regulator of sigma E protease